MAHRRGGSEGHAWFKRPVNSMLDDTTNSRPRDTHGPIGEPDDSVWGKIPACWNRPPDLAERLISKSKKNKVRDVDTTELVSTKQTKRRRSRTDESVGLKFSEDVVVYDQPKTEASRAAYEALLSQQYGGQPLNIVTCGAAGQPVSIGKLITTDYQDNRGDVNGTSAAGDFSTDHRLLVMMLAGAATESGSEPKPKPKPEDNEEEGDDSFYDTLHEYALDNEFEENEDVDYEAVHDKEDDVGVSVVEFKENEEIGDDAVHDEKKDEDSPTCDDDDDDDDDDVMLHYAEIGGLNVEEIDADWLQRKFSKLYDADMGPQRRQRFADQVLKLLDEGNVHEVEKVMLLEANSASQFFLILYLLSNRLKIVWCTRLARAENEAERKKIEKEMMTLGRPHTLVLKQLHAARRRAADKKQKMIIKTI